VNQISFSSLKFKTSLEPSLALVVIISAMQLAKLLCLASLVTAHGSDTQACEPACASGATCITQADGFWSQCLDCSKTSFFEECSYWDKPFRAAAEGVCEVACADKPGPPPPTDNCKGLCQSDRTCVEREDGYQSQCIACDESKFHDECGTWDRKILEVAEKTCQLNCAVCTAWNTDPYATGAHVSCCVGLQEGLGNWDGDGRIYYKCRQATISMAVVV